MISARYTHTDWPKWPPKARRWPPHTWSTRPNARPQRAHRWLRVAARTPSHAAARARIDRPTRRGSRTRDLRRRRPPRTHARRRSLRLALRGARGAVDAALGACWPCEESPIAPAGRPEQATGSVGGPRRRKDRLERRPRSGRYSRVGTEGARAAGPCALVLIRCCGRRLACHAASLSVFFCRLPRGGDLRLRRLRGRLLLL